MTKREFLDTVFALAPNEANAIMDAFDEYVDSNEPHWIPVTERLPETDKWRTTYIVTTNTGIVTAMEWENTVIRGKSVSRWIWHDRLSPWGVTAWMQKPEPYKVVTT